MQLANNSLIPYLTAGWPHPAAFVECCRAAAQAGCSAFEVGIPFSDPVADGPVIQRTSSQALAAGVGWPQALDLIEQACRASRLPAIAMSYANPLYAQGLEQSCQQLAQAGCQGLVIPDLTLEEGKPFEAAAQAAGLDLIYLVAPTTPPARAAQLAARSRGFVYLVSLRGVTGGRSQLPADLGQHIDQLQACSAIPVMVGFGISTPQQAAWVASRGAGVIVGSALLQALDAAGSEGAASACVNFLSPIRQAMLEPRPLLATPPTN